MTEEYVGPDSWVVMKVTKDEVNLSFCLTYEEAERVRAIWDNPPLTSFLVVDMYGSRGWVKSRDIAGFYETTPEVRRRVDIVDARLAKISRELNKELDPEKFLRGED